MPVSDRLAFGDFVLQRSQQRLTRRDGAPINLTLRLFSALLLLAERAGELLDKGMLMLALWPGLVVEENSRSQVISGLRRALGDDTQGGRCIQTVPRRGFRLIAAVTALPEQAPPVPPPVPLPAPMTQPAAAQAPAPASAAPVAASPGQRSHHQTDKRLALQVVWAAGLMAGLAGAGGWVWRRWGGGGPALSPGTGHQTLAVLPFKPLLAEGRDELLEVHG